MCPQPLEIVVFPESSCSYLYATSRIKVIYILSNKMKLIQITIKCAHRQAYRPALFYLFPTEYRRILWNQLKVVFFPPQTLKSRHLLHAFDILVASDNCSQYKQQRSIGQCYPVRLSPVPDRCSTKTPSPSLIHSTRILLNIRLKHDHDRK